jgi:class 3 adenylate cyclase
MELEKRIFQLKTLYDVSQEIVFLRSPGEILKNLLMMTMGTFGTFSGTVFMADLESRSVEVGEERGLKEGFMDLIRGHIEAGTGKIPLKYRLDSREGKCDKAPTGSFTDTLTEAGIEIWVPFTVETHVEGGIGLGSKLSDEPYTTDDEQLLTTLAAQGAMTVRNAKLIERMKSEETVRTNLARYLSPDVVEQIIQNKIQVDLGGDRKRVTVLFSDIRNFTSIVETQPPDKLVLILNEYFTAMARIIFENQGSLDKYIGDAIVAVFGSLIPLENAALNAAAAAVQMTKRLPEMNAKWSREHDGFSMDIGIGINTGEVFLGNIGSPERMVFTVIGDIVNVASRFSGLATPGQILATRETLDRIESSFESIALPSSNIKGKSDEIQIFEITY